MTQAATSRRTANFYALSFRPVVVSTVTSRSVYLLCSHATVASVSTPRLSVIPLGLFAQYDTAQVIHCHRSICVDLFLVIFFSFFFPQLLNLLRDIFPSFRLVENLGQCFAVMVNYKSSKYLIRVTDFEKVRIRISIFPSTN